MKRTTKGYLGVDAGTQGLSLIFADESLNVLGAGEGSYQMVAGLAAECYEQTPADWEQALTSAAIELRSRLSAANVEMDVLAIGISGQMHGEVLADNEGRSLGAARLWCDSRNEAEGHELTERFGVKMPKRITAARWLWTIRNQPDRAARTAHLTTPSGWLAYRLSGQWNLGIGDAAGMFPIDQATLNYDKKLLADFDAIARSAVGGEAVRPLRELLPTVRRCGEDGGTLTPGGAALLGLPAGIPIAPAEGDQPSALVGSLIAAAGEVAMSFGTSVCANSVGDRAFKGVSPAIDHFCAPDGKPINMVWLRNGTTYMSTIIEMFGLACGDESGDAFTRLMPQLLAAKDDCGGLAALPFMDDEPGVGVSHGGTALVIGLNQHNATPGNVAKAALLATLFNLRMGADILAEQGFLRSQIILSGGLTRTPELGQVVADAFQTPLSILEGGKEGTAFGAALLAKFRDKTITQTAPDWTAFLASHTSGSVRRFTPHAAAAKIYNRAYDRYRRLLGFQEQLQNALR